MGCQSGFFEVEVGAVFQSVHPVLAMLLCRGNLSTSEWTMELVKKVDDLIVERVSEDNNKGEGPMVQAVMEGLGVTVESVPSSHPQNVGDVIVCRSVVRYPRHGAQGSGLDASAVTLNSRLWWAAPCDFRRRARRRRVRGASW